MNRCIVKCDIRLAERLREAAGLTMADVSFAGLINGCTSVAWRNERGAALAEFLRSVYGLGDTGGERRA